MENKRIVRVFVRGGVVQDVSSPDPSIRVIVYDYDGDEKELAGQDEDGNPCNVSEW